MKIIDGTADLSAMWTPAPDAERAIQERGLSGDLSRIFFANRGNITHKWLHYLDIYERYFAALRSRPIRFLEIGVYKGGSLAMWRSYFGPAAVIFGIDVDRHCARHDSDQHQVRIGSQNDPAFLRSVAREMGSIDVVLDDGSHVAQHQKTSFDTLFPLLADGGLYVIEDLHTAYWPAFQGMYGGAGTAIEVGKTLIDDMHHWYHDRGLRNIGGDRIAAVHFHDSMIVIEKRKVAPPQHTMTGRDAGPLPVY